MANGQRLQEQRGDPAGEHRGIGVNAPDGILRREPASARGAPDPLGRPARPRRPPAPGAPAQAPLHQSADIVHNHVPTVRRAGSCESGLTARAPALPAFAMQHSRLSTACLGWNTSYAAELGLNGRARSWSTSVNAGSTRLRRCLAGPFPASVELGVAAEPRLQWSEAREGRIPSRIEVRLGGARFRLVRAARLGAQGGEEVPVEEAEEDQGGVRDGLVRELGATYGRGQPLDGFEGDGRGLRAGRQQREDRGWRTAISRYPRAMSRAMSIQSAGQSAEAAVTSVSTASEMASSSAALPLMWL